MRIRVRSMAFLVAVGVLAGCSAGSSSSTTHHPVMTSSSSAATAAGATVTPPATAGPRLPLLGVLPVPAGATPWPTNTNAQLSRTAYVESNYPKKYWATEEAEMASRRFVAAVQEGWDNPDGSRQAITIVWFEGGDGVTSMWDEVASAWETQYPHSFAD